VNTLPWEPAPLLLWRLDAEEHRRTWDSGEGARLGGGRWNSKGVPAIYASVDPATAILEVAVHKGFRILDAQPFVLTEAAVNDVADVRVVRPEDVPNPNWLVPGSPGEGQQSYGDELLRTAPFVLIPSAVSRHSWNLIFNPAVAVGRYAVRAQERFALDTRLDPAYTR